VRLRRLAKIGLLSNFHFMRIEPPPEIPEEIESYELTVDPAAEEELF
jgi:hypothetical protein